MLPVQLLYASVICVPFLLCSLLLVLLKNLLPTDKGREFAFQGGKSAGKRRGAGLVIILAFILSAVIFVPIRTETVIYYLMLFAGMLSGFLDDRAEKPWNEYKKGIIDLAICFCTAFTYVNFNPGPYTLRVASLSVGIPAPLFLVCAAVLLWVAINATNCSDGIDGFCGWLAILSLASVGIAMLLGGGNSEHLLLIAIMVFCLLAYLWRNSEPSELMMGDAGSRAVGLFLGIMVLKTGNPLLFIPFCFVLVCNGIPGIVKVFLLRFFKIKILKNIRTPLHDHFRKNKGWSNAQTIMRFSIIQILVSAIGVVFCW